MCTYFIFSGPGGLKNPILAYSVDVRIAYPPMMMCVVQNSMINKVTKNTWPDYTYWLEIAWKGVWYRINIPTWFHTSSQSSGCFPPLNFTPWKSHETSASSSDEIHQGRFSMVEADTDWGYGWTEQGILSACIKPTSEFLKIATDIHILWQKLIKHPELWLGVWKWVCILIVYQTLIRAATNNFQSISAVGEKADTRLAKIMVS